MKFTRFTLDVASWVTLSAFGFAALAPQSGRAENVGPEGLKMRALSWKPPVPVHSTPSSPPVAPQIAGNVDLTFKQGDAADPGALRRSHVLRIPVVRSKRAGAPLSHSPSETGSLGRALAGYQSAGGGETPEGRQAIEDFLAQHGDGEYAPSMRLELADAYWRTGAWERALDQWEKAWTRASKPDPADIESRRLADTALARLLQHTALLGRKTRLRELVDSVAQRQHGGDARAAVHQAKELLWFLEHRAEQNVFCGFSAANLVCVPLGQQPIFPDIDDEEEKKHFIATGVSLWDISQHSAESGGNLRCVQKADPAAPLAVPSVIHWNFGHFSAVTERAGDGKVHLEDAQLKFSSWVDPAVIAEAGSGYALVPAAGALPAGYREVPETEARTITGRHCVHGYDDEGCDPSTGTCPSAGGAPETDVLAMASYSLNLRRGNHMLTDTPVKYIKPGGGIFAFSLQYSSLPPVSVASLTNTYGFGPLWFAGFGGGSIELKGTGAPNTTVEWHTGTGNYNTYTYSAGVYTRRQLELPVLTYFTTGGPGYRLNFSDGSIQEYTKAVNSPVDRYLMTRTVDAQGNIQTLGYDSQARLISFTDEWSAVSVISYVPEPGDLASAVSYPGLIRRITDPHGRYAIFLYDELGRLVKITDPMGITSQFTYREEDFVDTLTTPYGKTTFAPVPSDYPGIIDPFGTALMNGVIVTDPRGYKEVIVQTDVELVRVLDASGNVVEGDAPNFTVRDWNLDTTDAYHGDATAKAPATVNGVSFLPKNHNLHWRNSFYWDKKAMFHSPNDWNAAAVYNWKANTSSYIGPALSSMRQPGQGRVWFSYPGQTSLEGPVTSYQPEKTVRQIEDETGTPTWVMSQQTYNPNGLPLISTDEKGRQTKITYTANNQDPATVQVLTTPPSTWTTLRTYGAFTANHLPTTVTEASGLITTYTYNAKGQATKVQLSKSTSLEAVRYTYSASGTAALAAWPGSAPGFLRKVERIDPANSAAWVTTDQYTYDSKNRVRTHTDASGYVRTYDYDDFDRPTLVTHPDSTTEQFSYLMADGTTMSLDRTASKDRAERWSRTLYSPVRQPVVQIAPDGDITQLDWCLCGQLQKLIDPLGRVTKWTWAPGGYLLEKLMPDGVTKTTYTYEANSGRLATVKRPKDQGGGTPTVTYRYFVDGRLQKEDYTDAGTPDVTYAFEANAPGRLTSVVDGIGTHALAYVALTAGTAGAGRLATLNGPLANDTISNAYDWRDRVTTENLLTDAAGNIRTETYTWDSLSRLKTVVNTLCTTLTPAFTFGYATNLPRPDSLTSPSSTTANITTSYTYNSNTAPGDSAQKLATITHTRSAIQQAKHLYTYDTAGRITAWEQQSISQPNMKTTYGYNLGDELVQAEDKNLSTGLVVDRENWGLDNGGNWLSRTRTATSLMETRTVDTMNRLTQIGGAGKTVVEGTINEFGTVTVNGDPAEMKADPVAGNYRFKKILPVAQGSNTVAISATDTDTPPQVTSQNYQFNVPVAARTFTYDANGNTLTDGVRTMTWDAKNRLKTVQVGANTWKWDYDYRDRRVKEYLNNVVTKLYIWSGSQIIQEHTPSTNAITRTHYFGGFSDGAAPLSGTKYETLTDHLGNIREVLTTTGTVAARYDYTPYQGPVLVGTATVTPTFLTIGRYLHHTGSGLELALYRTYDAELGRWMSEDPIGEKGGLNLYGYVRNRPTDLVDLKGQCPALAVPAVALEAAEVAVITGGVLYLTVPSFRHSVNDICVFAAITAEQAACLAACNAVYLAEFNVCNLLFTPAARKKCHEDILRQLNDCLRDCKP